jgi:hypothetical protein
MRYLLLCLTFAACSDRTEIVVGIATDLKARGQIDSVTFTASRNGVPVIQPPAWDLSDVPAGHYELPGSFGLYSPDGSEVAIELAVKGFKGTTLVTERDSLVRLVGGKTLFMRLGIVGDCGSLSRPTCAGNETCVEGVCRPIEIQGVRLPPFRQELVDHIACDSGTQWAVSSTGDLMPPISAGAECSSDEYCQEGTCYKLLANEDGGLTQGLWTEVASGTTLAMRALWGTSDGADVFAVGDRGAILHLTASGPMAASSFVPEVSGTTENLYAVYGTSATDVWAAGNNGTLLHRDASGWHAATSPTVARLEGLFALAPDDAWAVGRLDTSTPVMLHFTGGAWAKQTLPAVDDLRAVWGGAASDVWAVGHHGNVVHWTGSSFATVTAPDGDFEGVGGFGSDVFIVGRGGQILHNLTAEDSGVSADLFHIFASASGADVFAVGDYGLILHRENGAWVRQPARTDQPLFAVWGSAKGELFAAGRDGVVLHNTGVAAACVTSADCASACSGSDLTPRTCTLGACTDGTAAPCAGHYACADAAICRTTCATDTDCQGGFFCAPNGDCRARRAQGSYCDDIAGSDCQENGCRVCASPFFCTDHVCCDTSAANCGGAANGCMQCTAPSGTCSPKPFGSASVACETKAGGCAMPVCNGTGGCGNSGDACGASTCSGAPADEIVSNCQNGTCVANAPSPCPSPYCGFGPQPSACPYGTGGYCDNDGFCQAGEYCDGNHFCKAKKTNGQPCNLTSPKHCGSEGPQPSNPPAPCAECASGNCVDGFCCDAPCAGACQACDVPGKLGTCTTLTGGTPHGTRSSCSGTGACSGFCNGSSATACAAATGPCAAAQCDPTANNYTLKLASQCAANACPAQTSTSCEPYACAFAACKTSCTSNADCASTTPTCDVKTGSCH